MLNNALMVVVVVSRLLPVFGSLCASFVGVLDGEYKDPRWALSAAD